MGVMINNDAVFGKSGICYITIDGNRYEFMRAINIEAKLEKTKSEIDILGRMTKGHRMTGLNGTGSATFHYGSSIFRKLMKKLQDTGEDFYFDMQITNDDVTSTTGRQTVILRDCNIDSIILARVDASAEMLEDEFDFTFETFELPEEFNQLSKGI
ncbi:MAG: phage tail tube protein [Anaerotignaceae bacterium]